MICSCATDSESHQADATDRMHSHAIDFLSSIQLRAVKPPTAAASHSPSESTPRGSPKAASGSPSAPLGPSAARSPTAEQRSSSVGRNLPVGACLASSSLPSNMDSLEPRDTRAASLSSFEMVAWQSHAACEFLSGLTLRSQADVSREQQLSVGSLELDGGSSPLDPAAPPGALSLHDAQSASVAGDPNGADLLSKVGAKLVLSGATFSKLRHGGVALPPPYDPVGSRVLLAPRTGHRPCISFSVLRFHKEVLQTLGFEMLQPLTTAPYDTPHHTPSHHTPSHHTPSHHTPSHHTPSRHIPSHIPQADAAGRHGSRANPFVSEVVALQRRRQQQQHLAQQQQARWAQLSIAHTMHTPCTHHAHTMAMDTLRTPCRRTGHIPWPWTHYAPRAGALGAAATE
jgi:hypothetical protein